MKFRENHMRCIEGAIVRKKNQNLIQQQKILQTLLDGNYHLYGFFIAMVTKNADIFQFVCSIEGSGIPRLNDIQVLVKICQDI
mmetsp:Transcript_32819/g.50124  ORF Transcript_32819/g.50124 Transcript_32819/m.50124 type:complete len:83 (+) Transcript_32819:3634-3882(+)